MAARDDWFHWCGKVGVPAFVAGRIWRYARTVQRAAEIDCSIAHEATRAYWKKRDEDARAAILANVEKNCAEAVTVSFQGDPRGNCVRLVPVGKGFTSALGVPCGGFSATEFARIERIDARAVVSK